ncbi:GNAT family N-acetyltransferase [Patescibacteria group bacterium]|nr:GNAT family N-acetyltransferase [Patescibacteria group bacterium]MCL5797770.1 GNAT family N-acetyltransferase [Patescibacteria group bacterium]
MTKKTNVISIRFYKPADYKELSENLKSARMLHLPTDSEINFNKKIKRNPDSILIGQIDGKFAGNIVISEDGWNAVLFRLAVSQKYRKQGIGTKLLEKAVNILKRKRYDNVLLMADPNDKALIKFYKHRGFHPLVERLLMVKKL